MQIRAVRTSELEEVRLLLRSAGWDRKVNDEAQFRELIARSQIALVAVEAEEILGFVRALTDGLTNGYISMVVVAEKHRGKGVGSAIVRACMGENPKITWVLRAGRDGVSTFYEKLGFTLSRVAMERPALAEATTPAKAP